MKSYALLVMMMQILMPQLTLAYAPPAHFIIDRMLKARDGLKSLELIAEVKDLQKKVEFKETLRLDFVGGRYWTVVTDAQGQLASSKYGELSELSSLGQAWIEMAYDPSEPRFKSELQKSDVWPSEALVTQLLRDNSKVYWAWGKTNQFRIEKDEFVWAGFLDSKKNEIKVTDQARFPRVILIKTAGQDRFKYSMKQFKINLPVKWNTQTQVVPQGLLAGEAQEWIELVR